MYLAVMYIETVIPNNIPVALCAVLDGVKASALSLCRMDLICGARYGKASKLSF